MGYVDDNSDYRPTQEDFDRQATRIEELEGHLEQVREDHVATAARLAIRRREVESAEQRLEEVRGKLRELAEILKLDAEGAEQEAIRLGAEGEHHGEFEAKGIAVARIGAANDVEKILAALETPKQERDTEVRVEEEEPPGQPDRNCDFGPSIAEEEVERPSTCPACAASDPFRPLAPCTLDAHEPHPWHRPSWRPTFGEKPSFDQGERAK